MGLEKMSSEKDVIKKLRKLMAGGLAGPDDLPLKAVAKKRGNVFAFLMFETFEQKTRFSEMFGTLVLPQQKKMNLREVTKVIDKKFFKPVKT